MANKEPKNLVTDDRIEDITEFGELIPSFDQWTTYENQRRIVHHLQNCTSPEYRERMKRSIRE